VLEIRLKLAKYASKYSFEPELVDQVITQLIERGFLNDREFAKRWIEQRQSGRKPFGERVVRMELERKGISREMIEELFCERKEESPESEAEAASILVKRHWSRFSVLPNPMRRMKIWEYLARRGFVSDVISRVVDSMNQKDYN
jgi:regulatory protein